MEVRKGYKQTDIGIIPSDWELMPFKDVSFMKGRIGWQGLNQTEFTDNVDEPFLITGMNFKDGEIRWGEVYHVSEVRYEIAKEIQLKSGDVLMTKDGTIGKILFVDNIPYPYKATLNSHLLVFRPTRNSYFPKYLYYQLLSNFFKDFIDLNKYGTTFFGISQEAVGTYKVILPSLVEQTAIATALSDADALITSLEKLIAKKRLIKQGAMQELLKPREGWVVRRFADITKLITCGLAATPKYVDESVGRPFLSAQNVQDGKVVYDKYKFIPKSLFELITKHNPPKKGDLLYTRVGAGIGEAGVIDFDFEFGIYVSLTLIKTDEKQLFNYFLVQLLNSSKFKFLAKNGQFAGGGVQNLNVQIVREFNIPLPSIDEQIRIATILSDMDAEITTLETKLEKYRKIKLGMMQELLTGKIRLV